MKSNQIHFKLSNLRYVFLQVKKNRNMVERKAGFQIPNMVNQDFEKKNTVNEV